MWGVFFTSLKGISHAWVQKQKKKTSLILKEKISERKRVVRTSEKIG